MDKTLVEYIEGTVIPMYDRFDGGHGREHVRSVIEEAVRLAQFYPVDVNIVYTAAAYHDTGLKVDRKTHHLESGRIIRDEKDYWKRRDLMYKFDRLDKKWKYRAKNIFIQHNIDIGDIVATDDGHEGMVVRISPFGICFVNGNTSTSCSFRRIVEIRGKKLFKNIYFKFKRKTYGKADGEFHEMLLTYY